MARILRAEQRGPRVIEGVVVDATLQAREIIERARHAAAEELAHAREQGRSQGHAELAAAWIALAEARERMLAGLEPQAIEVAMQAAKRIVGKAVEQRPELIAEMVRPLLTRVRRARRVTLRVHPEDLGGLAALVQDGATHDFGGSLQVETDPTLSRGDCLVLSDIGTLDARIETQLAALARALRAP